MDMTRKLTRLLHHTKVPMYQVLSTSIQWFSNWAKNREMDMQVRYLISADFAPKLIRLIHHPKVPLMNENPLKVAERV